MLWTGFQVHMRCIIIAAAILCACPASSRPTPPTRPLTELPEEIARFFQDQYEGQHVQHLNAFPDFKEYELDAQPLHSTTPVFGLHAQTSASSWFPPRYSTPPLGHSVDLQNHPNFFVNHQMHSPVMGQHITANDIERKSPAPSNQFVSPMAMQAAPSSSNSLYSIRPDVLLNQGIWGHGEGPSPSSSWLIPHASSPPQLHALSQSPQQPIFNLPEIHPFSSTRRPAVQELQPANEENKAPGNTRSLVRAFQGSPGLKVIGDFRTVIQPDYEVAWFINRLRSNPLVGQEGGSKIEDQIPVEVKESFLEDPNTLAIRVFYARTIVKQLVLKGEKGERYLLLTLSPHPNFLAQRGRTSVVGVWELGEVKSAGDSLLYMRGFYRFTPKEFEELGRIPQIGMKQYGAVVRKVSTMSHSNYALRLSFEKLDESVGFTSAESGDTAEIQQQLEPSEYEQGVQFGRRQTGRYLFTYEYSPEVAQLTQKWKEEAKLSQDAFIPIKLTKEQRRNIGPQLKFSFHKAREAKELYGPGGEPLMLVHYARSAYFPQQRNNILAIWRFGPMVDEQQKLIALGFYQLSAAMWRQMTPERLRGLRIVYFQYNWTGPRELSDILAENQAQRGITLARPFRPVWRHEAS
ncbi:uncharacterized protein UTRI_10056 [Ustilago trichophora]|uniref:Uncharacterized protein n=1 Tax=Ustilago trichophora TaxID=86804 RepID=A0A5C3DTI1_9BASI|nr:uncharacterized protein UTRI_10056 [Ustilago trichophora]